MRQNYELTTGVKALDFGSAVHAGLEAFYNPITWHDKEAKEAMAILAFNKLVGEHRTKSLTINGVLQTELSFELETDFAERKLLGETMLDYYFDFSAEEDKEIEPVLTEIEFEVPIYVPQGLYAAYNLRYLDFTFDDSDGILKYKRQPVLYQGRVDLLWQNKRTRKYAVIDHKTTAQFGQYQHLVLDEQVSSYDWALTHMLKLDIDRVIFNQLRKALAHEPEVLKSGALSKNKQQNTTYKLYMQAIEEKGYSVDDYTDFLDFLKEQPKEFVRRIEVKRNEYQRKQQGIRIFQEAVEMLGNPIIYPSPSAMNCNGCWFYNPCVATNDGGDVDFFLNELYTKRKEVEPDGQE
jgi:CRISPR/Cas system-associated exonuclease Cas4 (RecB family)